MFYRAAIVKEDKNARSITLREMTKEKVEEMIPRIKASSIPTKMQAGTDIGYGSTRSMRTAPA